MKTSHLQVALCAVLALAGSLANAAIVTYTDQAAFMAALSGSATTLDFESVTAPFVINSGDTLGGITFNYSFGSPPPDMQVSSSTNTGYATTSGTNFLGTTDADIFLDDDDFTMDFAAIKAIGLYIITAEEPGITLFDDDIQLAAGGGTALLDVSAIQQTLSDGSRVYFLGLIDTGGNFTGASLTTPNSSTGFYYNIDDITTATVEVVDTDGDGITDGADNCTNVANAAQIDTDADGHGNACDGDFQNNCLTNIFDLFAFKANFAGSDQEFDFNSTGGPVQVNIFDLFIFKGLFGSPPGPSAAGLCP